MIDFTPIWLSLKLATLTSLILFILALPISYWIAYSNSRFRPFIETMVSMPLVLPPTVIGFYFLIALSPKYFAGAFFEGIFGFNLLFSFSGLVIASIIYSLPFMVNPLSSGMASIDRSLIEASAVLGKSDFSTFIKVILPNMKPAILSALVLTFAHTLGEFGVVLMIGGNIPDKTRVASIAIYDRVEALDYSSANTYSLILLALSFSVLFILYLKKGRDKKGVLL